MRTQQTNPINDISTGDRAVMACMAALVMFIAGYTASRVVLSHTTATDNVAAENTVIPHQGEMWRAFGEN